MKIGKKAYVLACILIVFSACTSKDLEKKSPEQIDLHRAREFQKAGRYDLALERYETIKNKYPLSPEAVEAELEIAETYYLQGSYVESLAYFQSFRDLHPNHAKVDMAAFRIGMSYYNQLPSTIERDLTTATKAVDAFDDFLSSYPKSGYVPQAKEKKNECLGQLAEKEFYIGEFYFKREKYQSALGRFQTVLKKYRGIGLDEKVLYHIGMCYFHLNKKTDAKETFQSLLKQFPKSKFTEPVNEMLKKI